MSREMRKGFTAEDIKNAIDNSDYTYTTIAAWLALNVSKNKTCKPETAKKYIQRFHLEAYLEMKMAVARLLMEWILLCFLGEITQDRPN